MGHLLSEFIHPADEPQASSRVVAAIGKPGSSLSITYRRKINRAGESGAGPAGLWLLVQFVGHSLGKLREPLGLIGWETPASATLGELSDGAATGGTPSEPQKSAAGASVGGGAAVGLVGGTSRLPWDSHDRIMTYAMNELRNSLHVMDASAVSVLAASSSAAALSAMLVTDVFSGGGIGGGGPSRNPLSALGGALNSAYSAAAAAAAAAPASAGATYSSPPTPSPAPSSDPTLTGVAFADSIAAPPGSIRCAADDATGSESGSRSGGGAAMGRGAVPNFSASGSSSGGGATVDSSVSTDDANLIISSTGHRPAVGAGGAGDATSAAARAENFASVGSSIRAVNEGLVDILLAIKSAAILISNVLTLTQLREGKLVPSPEAVAPRLLLRDIVMQLRPAARVPLHLIASPNLPPLVVVDPALVSEIVLNAAANAVRHADRGAIFVVVSCVQHALSGGGSGSSSSGAVDSHGERTSSASGPAAAVAADASNMREEVDGAASATKTSSEGASNAGAASVHSSAGVTTSSGGSNSAVPSSSYTSTRSLLIEVIDTGAGFGGQSQDALASALANGAQVRGSRAQRASLYLPIVMRLAEAMGGSVIVSEATQQGRGRGGGSSTVRTTKAQAAPAAAAAAPVAGASVPSAPSAPASSGSGRTATVAPAPDGSALGSSSGTSGVLGIGGSSSVIRFALTLPFTEPTAEESVLVDGMAVPDFIMTGDLPLLSISTAMPPLPYGAVCEATGLSPACPSSSAASASASGSSARATDAMATNIADAAASASGLNAGRVRSLHTGLFGTGGTSSGGSAGSVSVTRSGDTAVVAQQQRGQGDNASTAAATAAAAAAAAVAAAAAAATAAARAPGGGAQLLPPDSSSPLPESTPTSTLPPGATPEGGPGGSGSSSAAALRRRHKFVGFEGQSLNMHVLLVDDVGIVRRTGEAFLEMLGCSSVCLEDGDLVEAALEASVRPFDAIVMDIVMHRSDGAEVCRTLRERWGVRCPIIAMTGNTSSRDVQRYFSMGFDVVLPKPFSLDRLGRALVEGRQRRGGNTRFVRQSAHGNSTWESNDGSRSDGSPVRRGSTAQPSALAAAAAAAAGGGGSLQQHQQEGGSGCSTHVSAPSDYAAAGAYSISGGGGSGSNGKSAVSGSLRVTSDRQLQLEKNRTGSSERTLPGVYARSASTVAGGGGGAVVPQQQQPPPLAVDESEAALPAHHAGAARPANELI